MSGTKSPKSPPVVVQSPQKKLIQGMILPEPHPQCKQCNLLQCIDNPLNCNPLHQTDLLQGVPEKSNRPNVGAYVGIPESAAGIFIYGRVRLGGRRGERWDKTIQQNITPKILFITFPWDTLYLQQL